MARGFYNQKRGQQSADDPGLAVIQARVAAQREAKKAAKVQSDSDTEKALAETKARIDAQRADKPEPTAAAAPAEKPKRPKKSTK